jgi:hypothetical protein
MLSFNIIDCEISQKMPDNLFNLMCIKSVIKNETLFNSFFHDNYYVRNNIKKITRK